MNSHRVSRVNKFLQLCSSKQTPSLSFNKFGSPAPTTIIYDKQGISQEVLRIQQVSLSCLIIDRQLRTITYSLLILWFDSFLLKNKKI